MASATSLPTLATSVQVLKELGEQMGFKGIELREFIKKQQEMEREERTKQREYEKEQRVYEKENAKLAAEEQEKQRVFEREKWNLSKRIRKSKQKNQKSKQKNQKSKQISLYF